MVYRLILHGSTTSFFTINITHWRVRKRKEGNKMCELLKTTMVVPWENEIIEDEQLSLFNEVDDTTNPPTINE